MSMKTVEELLKRAAKEAPGKKDCTVEHHAVLFGLLARAAIEAKWESGPAAILQATARYAAERGERMAAAAMRNGDPVDLVSFNAYGELVLRPEEHIDSVAQKEPAFITLASKCCWAEIWEQYGLLEYGKFYCTVVDNALFHGFKNGSRCTLSSALSWGAPQCTFNWNIPMSADEEKRLAELKAKLGASQKKDFTFHTAHLYHTVGKELCELFGDDGITMVERALDEFAGLFGKEYLASLIGVYESTNLAASSEV
jgi:hypothetical protein